MLDASDLDKSFYTLDNGHMNTTYHLPEVPNKTKNLLNPQILDAANFTTASIMTNGFNKTTTTSQMFNQNATPHTEKMNSYSSPQPYRSK